MSRTRLITAGVIAHREMSDKDKMEMNLIETGLSVRTVNTLESYDIYTVGELLETTKDELLGFINFGEKTLIEVFRALDNLGFNRESNQTKDGVE